ncbi:MAG: hypothetical protein IPL80_13970 [Sterolibacteriaceae bacterium]|nr:hypothetical protein [Sterolibacteriaceae bacterium]
MASERAIATKADRQLTTTPETPILAAGSGYSAPGSRSASDRVRVVQHCDVHAGLATIFCRQQQDEIAESEGLNPWYKADSPRAMRPTLGINRESVFDEVQVCLREGIGPFEARCRLFCGVCLNGLTESKAKAVLALAARASPRLTGSSGGRAKKTR